MRRYLDLENLVVPIIKTFGCEFVGLECISADQNAILRIYIDKEQGLSVEDCKKVSYQVDQVLTVDGNYSNYTLEVSSPGIERKLYSIEQCKLQIGKTLKISVAYPIDGQRNFKGVLQSVQGEQIYLTLEDGRVMAFNFEDVDRARIFIDKLNPK